jgi:hypothetical protein
MVEDRQISIIYDLKKTLSASGSGHQTGKDLFVHWLRIGGPFCKKKTNHKKHLAAWYQDLIFIYLKNSTFSSFLKIEKVHLYAFKIQVDCFGGILRLGATVLTRII